MSGGRAGSPGCAARRARPASWRAQTPKGGVPVELAVPGPTFVEEFRKRGFDLRVFER